MTGVFHAREGTKVRVQDEWCFFRHCSAMVQPLECYVIGDKSRNVGKRKRTARLGLRHEQRLFGQAEPWFTVRNLAIHIPLSENLIMLFDMLTSSGVCN